MSAAPSQLDIKPFPVHHLQQDTPQQTTTITTTTTPPPPPPPPPPLGPDQEHGLLLHHHSSSDFGPSSSSSTTLHQAGSLDTLDFGGDITSFSYDHLHAEEPPLISSLQQDYGPVLEDSSQQQSVPASLRDRHTSAPSLTAPFPGQGRGTNSSRERSSMDGSDGDSPGTRPQSDPLEEAVPDEFGLASSGPRDGSDLGFKRKEDKTDQSPAWSELKTKAGKERKRLPLACIGCRRKKIRCSGEKPACKHCIRSKVPCVYKVTARKAAPRTDYMTMLDKRLKRMEERIIKIVPKNEQDPAALAVVRATVKPAIPGTLGSIKGSRKRGAEEAFGNGPSLESWAKAPVTTHSESPSQGAVKRFENEELKLLHEGADRLPSMEMQVHLAGIFFEHVYGQAYYILHRPSYMRKLSAGTLPPVLVLSVCAVAARYSKHPDLSSDPAFMRGDQWADTARDIVTKRYEWPNITILSCLLLLGLHEFGSCQGHRSWSLGGQAIRMAFALQLHLDLDHDPQKKSGTPLTFVDREIRRRIMWACYVMDRFNSSGTDRPTFIKDEAIKIPLPVKEQNFIYSMPAHTENLQGDIPNAASLEEGGQIDARENMGVAAYIIKTLSIWGRAIMHINQGGKDADTRLMWEEDSEYAKIVQDAEAMELSLPAALQYSQDNLHTHATEGTVNQFVFLHVAIQANILFLNRLAMGPDPKFQQQGVPTTFVSKAGKRAFQTASRVSELLKDAEAYPNINAPFLGYCAYLSSTVHIYGSFTDSQTIKNTSEHHLGTNIKFFQAKKRGWAYLNSLLENLRLQYRDTSDAHRNGALADFPSPKILQYGDWIDAFPNGLSESDWIDPTYLKKKEKGEDAVLEQKPELQTVEDFFTTLTPPSRDASGRSNSMSLKRKATVGAKRKASMSARDHHSQHLQPLMTGLTTPEEIARLQQQHGTHYPGATLGGQTSGAAAFSSLSAVPHANTYGPAISPISPVAVGHGHFANHQHDMYNEVMAMQLAQAQQEQNLLQTHPMLGGQFGAPQGMDPTAAATAALMDGLPGWTNGGDNGGSREDSRGGGGGNVAQPPHNGGGAPDTSHGNPHHTVYGHDPSNSWFSLGAYGLDATEVGDVGGMTGMGFGSLFDNANAGRAPGGH